MKKIKLLTISALCLFLLSHFSLAQEKNIFKFKKFEPFKWERFEELKLSDEQQKKFEELDLEYEKKLIDLRAEVEKAELAKRELLRKGNFSKKDYMDAVEKIIQAENKIRLEEEKLKMDKYSLLDEKQRKVFIDRSEKEFVFKFDMKDFKDRMKKFKERMKKLIPYPSPFDEINNDLEVEIFEEI